MQMKAQNTNPYPIFLYIPNLIGYARIGCMLAAFKYAMSDWYDLLAIQSTGICYAAPSPLPQPVLLVLT